MKALFTLLPHESKRLIAKGVSVLPEVKAALSNGKIAIAGGISNGYVAEELSGEKIGKGSYTAGIVTEGVQCLTDAGMRLKPFLINQGKSESANLAEAVQSFERDDVFIKGANAVDIDKNAGVLMANPKGGTVSIYPLLVARGCHLIIPVGLEKLVPDVIEASNAMGITHMDKRFGKACGMLPITTGKVITEIEAFALLTGITATHVASGGVSGSEGACTFVVEGDQDQLDDTVALVKQLKKEPTLSAEKQLCSDCNDPCEMLSP